MSVDKVMFIVMFRFSLYYGMQTSCADLLIIRSSYTKTEFETRSVACYRCYQEDHYHSEVCTELLCGQQ